MTAGQLLRPLPHHALQQEVRARSGIESIVDGGSVPGIDPETRLAPDSRLQKLGWEQRLGLASHNNYGARGRLPHEYANPTGGI